LASAGIPKKNEDKNKNKFEFGYDNLSFCSFKYNKKKQSQKKNYLFATTFLLSEKYFK